MFHKKAVLKTLAIFTGKHLCWNLFFDKNAGLQGPSFIKNTLEHRCFLRTLRNFSEHLFWKTSANGCFWDFHLSFSLYNIGSEEDVFSKIKQNKNRSKTQLYKKIWIFHDVLYQFLFLFFSTSRQMAFALHVKKTVLIQLNQWAINPGPMEKLFTYTVHFVLITWISWARKCCIIICIVITNTKFVAHRCI